MATQRPQPLGRKHLQRMAPDTPLGGLRWRHGYSQTEAGRAIGAETDANAQKRMSEIERGESRLKPADAAALGRLYGVAACKVRALADAAYVTKHPGAVLGHDPHASACDGPREERGGEEGTMATTGAGLTERRPVVGRELTEAVAFVIMQKADGRVGESVKARDEDLERGLGDLGLSASTTMLNGARADLLRSKRIFVVRDSQDMQERVYKTTDALAALAKEAAARLRPESAPQAAPEPPDAVAAPARAEPPAPPVTGPPSDGDIESGGDLPAGDLVGRPALSSPSFTQEAFDTFMLDFLGRASEAAGQRARAEREHERACHLQDRMDTLGRQFGAVCAERDAWKRKAEGATLLTANDRHALRKAGRVLEQLTQAGPMQPMVEALLATLKLAGEDLRVARDLVGRLEEAK